MRMRGFYAGLGAVLITAGLTGCGSENNAQTGQSTANTPSASPPSSPAKPPRQAFDPPKVFEKSGATFPDGTFFNQDKRRATLSDGTLYSVSDGKINAYDALTAEPLWLFQAKVKSGTNGYSAPAVAYKDRVYVAFSGYLPAQGTTKAHPQIEVVAIDAKSGKADWSTTIDVDHATYSPGDGEATVAGVTDTSVVVSFFHDDPSFGQTFVLDATSHNVRWSKDKFLAGEVDSGVIVGNGGKPLIGEPRTLTGLAETDGTQKWSTDLGGFGTTIMPISPKLVASSRKLYDSLDHQFDIVDVSSGKAVYSKLSDIPTTSSFDIKCFYDQTSIIACAAGGKWAFAFDAASVGPNPLWEIKEDGARSVPSISAAYHGLIYGSANGSPVALDAKTGKDAPDSPGAAPEMVDKYGALAGAFTYKPTK